MGEEERMMAQALKDLSFELKFEWTFKIFVPNIALFLYIYLSRRMDSYL